MDDATAAFDDLDWDEIIDRFEITEEIEALIEIAADFSEGH